MLRAIVACMVPGRWCYCWPRLAVEKTLSIIQELGPSLGLFVNPTKCELFSRGDLSSFPIEMKRSNVPRLEILGAPIGDLIFCAKIVAQKRASALKLLTQLSEVGSADPQVALLLLRQCVGFCKLVHLSRSTPPSLVADALRLYDDDVRQCFTECTSVDTPNHAWQQAQLSLSRGGLGLRCLSHHSSAAYIASLTASDSGSNTNHHLLQSIQLYNSLVPVAETVSMEAVLESPGHQKVLSSRCEDHQFRLLFQSLSLPNRARLLSASSHHASAWLQVVPAPGLNLHLDPSESQAGIKWWLGIDSSQGANCPFCSSHCLDPLGHHALTCKYRGDVVSRHNKLRDVFLETCRRACIGACVEAGSGLGHDQRRTRPADVLVPGWMLGKPAAFDITVTSPLNPSDCDGRVSSFGS